MSRITLLLLIPAIAAHADLVGQIDTFTADTAGWNSTHTSVSRMPGNGPGGAGDPFMQLSISGFHLGAANKAQWTGDYLSAGITSIEADLNYIAGPNTVNVRLLLWGDGGVWASSSTTPVTAGWNHYSFSLDPSDLVLVSLDVDHAYQGTGSGVLNDTLSTVNALLLRNDSEAPTMPGQHPPHITATIGVDNIQAVPEPGSLAYLLVAAVGIYLSRTHRQHAMQ